MTSQYNRQNTTTDLRKLAEEKVRQNDAQSSENIENLSTEEIKKLLYELRVHQMELELQNDELRQTQSTLKATQKRYFDLYDLAPMSYCTLTANGMIAEINMTGSALLATPRNELLQQPLTNYILLEDQELYSRHRQMLYETGETQGCDLRMVTGRGKTFWAHLEATVTLDTNGAPVCWVLMSDISAAKQVDDTLRETNDLNQSLLRTIPFPINIVNTLGQTLFMNDVMLQKMGKRALQPHCCMLPKNDLQKCAHCPLKKPIQIGVTESFECSALPEDKAFEIIYTGMIFKGQEAHLKIYIDITDRKKTELELRESEKRFSATFDQAAVGIAHVALDGRWLRVNRRLCDIIGYNQQELQTRTFQSITHPEDLDADMAFFGQTLEGKITSYSKEKRYFRKDGTIVWINITVSLVRTASGDPDYFISVIEDISKRKNSEKTLLENEAIFNHFMENSPIYVFFKDHNIRTIRLSRNYEQMLGRPLEEILGKTMDELFPSELSREMIADDKKILQEGKLITVDEQFNGRYYTTIKFPIIINHQHQYLAGYTIDITERKRAEAERELLTKAIEQSDETVIITDPEGIIQYVNPTFEKETGYSRKEAIGQSTRILNSGKQDQVFYQQLWATLTKGDTFHGRLVNKRKDGSFFTEDVTISPVLDTAGTISNYVAVKRNVTSHIQLEAKFQQAQKMESVGRLAGGVAHDYNNMLSVIIGYTELAMDRVDPADSLHDNLQEILNAAQRSASITRQLLAFARKQTIVPKTLDLNTTVEEMLKMLRRLVGEEIELHWKPAGRLWPVKMDPSQIDQILANLCVNARDAITGTGMITIETDMVSLDESYCAEHAGFIPGNYVQLTVSDNGCGMDGQTLDHVFEPFFTTKGIGEGTGLGLATVYGIVKQNEGLINVYSEPGKGTTFTIYLPQQVGADDISTTPVKVSIPMGHGETVLVVEDELSILRLIRTTMEGLGYKVLTAGTPGEAMQLAKTSPSTIELLLTDVIMPELNGRELADWMHTYYPNIQILFMSGYTASAIAHHGVLEEGVCFIHKPFSKLELATKVREALQQNHN